MRICPAGTELLSDVALPKKKVSGTLKRSKLPHFIEAGEFQTPFFGQSFQSFNDLATLRGHRLRFGQCRKSLSLKKLPMPAPATWQLRPIPPVMPTSHSLAERIALLTGGASGLGRGAAEAMAAAGAHILIADIDEAGGRTVAGALAGSFVALDVADEAAWLELEALVKRETWRPRRGGPGCGHLRAPGATVANVAAGLAKTDGGEPGRHHAGDSRCALRDGRARRVHHHGRIHHRRARRPRHRRLRSQQGRGSAADSGGGAGRRQDGAGCPGQLALVPGPMETPLLDWLLHATPLGPERTQELMLAAVPLERFGRPDEFGALACFLASEASSYITGADLPLDGGGTA
jgi:hypothetical protein